MLEEKRIRTNRFRLFDSEPKKTRFEIHFIKDAHS